MIFISTIK